MASKRIGTRENPTSPLHSGIPYPENILREARQNLGFASLSDPWYSSDSKTLGGLD